MKRLVLHFIGACACATLVACGGGGGGGGTTTLPIAAISNFLLRTAYIALLTQGGTQNFSVSERTSSGAVASGSGSLTIGPLTLAVFEGVSAQQVSIGFSGSFSSGGLSPFSTLRTGFLDANLLPLGSSSGSDYQVTVSANIPFTASVGDSGLTGTTTIYSDSSKSVVLGTETTTYALAGDTSTTALLKISTVTKNISGVTTNTSTEVDRISLDGSIKRVTLTSVDQAGTTVTMTF